MDQEPFRDDRVDDVDERRHAMDAAGLDDQGRPWNQGRVETSGEGTSPGKPLLSRGLQKLGMETSSTMDRVLDWAFVLGLATALSVVVMQVGVARMMVPTRSMAPSIQPGDSFFVDKFTYWSGLKSPDPGDIVVFWHEQTAQACEHQLLFWKWQEAPPCQVRYVKRLVAVGPTTVMINEGDIFVNGERMTGPEFDRRYTCGPNGEGLFEGCRWRVPSGKMFVLGDNTTNSRDSRYWGFADRDSLIGEPFLRVWPPGRTGLMNGYLADAAGPDEPHARRH